MEIKKEIDDKLDLGIVKEEYLVDEENSGQNPQYPMVFLDVKEDIKLESQESDQGESSKTTRNDCEICGKKFDNALALERHRDWHDPGIPGVKSSSKASGKKKKASVGSEKKKKYLCTHCPNRYSSKSGLRYHLDTISNTKKFECAECDKKYLMKSILRNHMVMVHMGKPQKTPGRRGRKPKNPDLPHHPGPYMCETCGKSLKTKAIYERHQFVHSDVKNVACHVCGKMFACKEYLSTHMLMHTKRGTYICKVCNKTYNSRGGLLYHKKSAHSEAQDADGNLLKKEKQKKNECERCGLKFLRKSQVKKHILEEHLGGIVKKEAFVCEQCGKELKSKGSYDRHKFIHSDTKTEMCPVCGKMFSCKQYLGVHMLNHREKESYTCPICKKVYSRTGYQYHKKHAHREKIKKKIEKYKCAKCKMIFPKKHQIKYHLLKKHFKNLSGIVHVCATCGKTFNTKGSYDRHQVVHSNIKTIMCPYCGKMFACKEYLSTHLLMHTKRGGYVCDVCSKAYNSRGGLLHHKRSVHTGIGFPCGFCEKKLASKGSLKHHIQSFHTEISEATKKGRKRKRTRKNKEPKVKAKQPVVETEIKYEIMEPEENQEN